MKMAVTFLALPDIGPCKKPNLNAGYKIPLKEKPSSTS